MNPDAPGLRAPARDEGVRSQSLAAGSLEALLESAKLLHSSLELDDLLLALLRSVMGRLVVSRGLIALDRHDGRDPRSNPETPSSPSTAGGRDPQQNQLRVAAVRGVKNLTKGDIFDPEQAGEAGIDLVLAIGDPEPTGYLGLGSPLTGRLGTSERQFLEALLGIAASAIDNARAHADTRRLNLQLDRRVQQLRTLLDLVRSFTGTLEPQQVAQRLSLTLTGQWLVRKSAIVAWKQGHPTVVRERGMCFDDPESLSGELQQLTTPQYIENLEDGPLLQALEHNDAVIVVPLTAGPEVIGFAALGAPAGNRRFQEEDLDFCAGLAAQAAVAFGNSWYFVEAVERQKLERDLALAGDIQRRLFPRELPQLPGCQIAARNRPASEVGGDYYDALPVDPCDDEGNRTGGRTLLCVADVSGKGMAASLLMSNIQATLRALLGGGRDLASLVARTSQLIYQTTPANKYVTAIFLLLDPATGKCRFVNAGHNEGLVIRKGGEVETLDAGGLPVGLFPSGSYREGELQLEPGDVVALYSDGVNEANDPDDNEFEMERLIEGLRSRADQDAQSILDGIFADVDAFAGSAPQYDDITMLVLKHTETPN